MNSSSQGLAGLYIHVPFCQKKCRYCDFYSTPEAGLIPDYIKALIREMDLAGPLWQGRAFDTVYLGGGTPSLLSPKDLQEILAALRERFLLTPDLLVSMEANPGTVAAGRLAAFRELGVGRIHLGVQSFDDGALAFLGRIHNGKQAEKALALCREAGFTELGADLILAVPGRGAKTLKQDLDTLLAYSPEHVSCYLLSWEPGTPLALSAESGECAPLHPDRASADYLLACRLLHRRGYLRYEVSNWSRGAEHRSRHNLKYWQGAAYLGLGPSAHSFAGGVRRANHRELGAWMDALARGELPQASEEKLSLKQKMLERLYLALRCDAGLGLADFAREFGLAAPPPWEGEMQALCANRLARRDGERLALTDRGILVLDAIVKRLGELADCRGPS